MKCSLPLLILGLTVAQLLGGCGGGSSSSAAPVTTTPAPAVTGVKTPSTVSVVTAN